MSRRLERAWRGHGGGDRVRGNPEHVSSPAPLHILLVEDNPVNQLMAQGTLSVLGHQVTTAADGQEAVRASRDHRFDLILMDLMLPVMDGFQASATILHECHARGVAAPPIVALTAVLDEAEKSRCAQHGMAHWLSKPICLEEFQKLSQSLTGSAQAPAPAESGPAREVIDSEALRDRVKDPEVLAKIVDLFSEGYPMRLQEARDSLDPEHSVVARRAAHTLKGNFLNFGADEAAEMAHRLMDAIEEERWKDAEAMLPEMAQQCALVERALRALAGMDAPQAQPASELPGTGFKVVVADGDPANRALCSAVLQEGGYEILEAPDGEGVLRLLEAADVDVVVMGVIMAGLDGYETCRRIKASPTTGMLPVLLLTALDDRDARLQGMDAGADDFLSKPVDPTEVSLRVRNAARGKAMYDQLQRSFVELQELEGLRDGLTHMLVHDMRTPLTAIKGYASLLATNFGAGLTDQQRSFAEKMVVQSNRLVEMVSAILDVSRLESNQLPLNLTKIDLCLLLLTQSEPFSGMPDHSLRLELPDSLFITCDQDLIGRVLMNLLTNAFKYTPPKGVVTLALSGDDKTVTVAVIDQGPGVPLDSREKIFEKFGVVEGETHRRPYSSGLGLTFCQLVVQKHGGEIGVDDGRDGVGSRFWFTLPLKPVQLD